MKTVPEGSVKIPLPSVQMKTTYSCGAAALQSIMAYYGIGPDDQGEYICQLSTSPYTGTAPRRIARLAREHGLSARIHYHMTLQTLKWNVARRRPVICAIQAWGTPDKYPEQYAGHYVVAVGFDKETIYFRDPAIEGLYGYMECDEFEERWHDFCASTQKACHHLGIVAYKPHARHYSKAVRIY